MAMDKVKFIKDVETPNLVVQGDLTVNGSTVTESAENLLVKDAVIVVNSGNEVVTTNMIGTVYRTGAGDYAIVYNNDNEALELGYGTYDEVNNTFTFNENEGKPIAIRDIQNDKTIPVWDEESHSFIDSPLKVSDTAIQTSGVLEVNKTYELGSYYSYDEGLGWLIDIGEAAKNTMVAIHITGNSYDNATSGYPIDSIFQFYDYNDTKGITSSSGIDLGDKIGDMSVYRYNGRLYAYIKPAMYQTYNFTIMSNKSGLTPTITKAVMHTEGYTDLVTITSEELSDRFDLSSYATNASLSTLQNSTIQYNDILQTTNPFGGKKLYISKIDDALYVADKRFTVTVKRYNKVDDSFDYEYPADEIAKLFDGSYETCLECPLEKYIIINITLPYTQAIASYPYGNILLSYYYDEQPESVSARVYCNYESHGIGWHDLTVEELVNTTYARTQNIRNDYYQISQIEITIVAPDAGKRTRVTTVEMRLDRPNSDKTPFLSKYSPETLYYNLTAPNFIGNLTGTASRATADANGNNIVDTYLPKSDIKVYRTIQKVITIRPNTEMDVVANWYPIDDGIIILKAIEDSANILHNNTYIINNNIGWVQNNDPTEDHFYYQLGNGTTNQNGQATLVLEGLFIVAKSRFESSAYVC